MDSSHYQKQDASGNYQLEDGFGSYLLESADTVPPPNDILMQPYLPANRMGYG